MSNIHDFVFMENEPMDDCNQRRHTEEAPHQEVLLQNHDAFTVVYRKHFGRIVSIAQAYVKDIEIAKEITQNIFLKLFEEPPHLQNANALPAYLHRAAINHSINYLRREKRMYELHHHMASELQTNNHGVDEHGNLAKEMLQNAIATLPPKCGEILKMSRYQNLKYSEIAEQLGIAEKTVENHIVAAFKHIRRNLRHRVK